MRNGERWRRSRTRHRQRRQRDGSGGKTSNGHHEAVINAVPWDEINNNQVKVIVDR